MGNPLPPATTANIPLDKRRFALDIVSVERKYALLIEEALKEDIGGGDITTQAIIPPDLRARGLLIAKKGGVICGLPLAEEVFKRVGEGLKFGRLVEEGEKVQKGKEVAWIKGEARAILKGERVALNFLGRLSGIASLTAEFVAAIAGTKARILDTRKTTPGWRSLEKYAVRKGGGLNHRLGLYDMVLIKDNHIDLVGGIPQAIGAGSTNPLWKGKIVEVEVRDLRELREALSLGVKRILLDNFSLPQIGEAMKVISQLKGRDKPKIEVSGGVNLKNVRDIAQQGVDYISVGRLTHSVRALDFSLTLKRIQPCPS